MSAPVLSLSEQKASISGKKKKKKTIKNVLNVPKNPITEPQVIQESCFKTLSKILERLLPTARLPIEKVNKDKNTPCEETTNKTQMKIEAKNKRNQLSLGVNALNRNIKKDLISSVLLADNIQPKFLIHHLNLLCDHKQIPYLLMPSLREITNKCLGFPCIALGFKKNFNDFSEAVKEIISISQTNNVNSCEKAQESESDEEEITDDEIDENKEENNETPFTYLYRTSTKERIFVPESIQNDQASKKEDANFIKVEEYDVKSESKPSELVSSFRVKKRTKTLKKLKDFDNSEMDDNEDLEVPKKRPKKDWIIDKKGTKQNIKYYPTNLLRFPSNPDRIRRNK